MSEQKRVSAVHQQRAEAAASKKDGKDKSEVEGGEEQQGDEDEEGAAEGDGKSAKNKEKNTSKRPDRVADSVMKAAGTRINQEPILGHVPGIAVNQK